MGGAFGLTNPSTTKRTRGRGAFVARTARTAWPSSPATARRGRAFGTHRTRRAPPPRHTSGQRPSRARSPPRALTTASDRRPAAIEALSTCKMPARLPTPPRWGSAASYGGAARAQARRVTSSATGALTRPSGAPSRSRRPYGSRAARFYPPAARATFISWRGATPIPGRTVRRRSRWPSRAVRALVSTSWGCETYNRLPAGCSEQRRRCLPAARWQAGESAARR